MLYRLPIRIAVSDHTAQPMASGGIGMTTITAPYFRDLETVWMKQIYCKEMLLCTHTVQGWEPLKVQAKDGKINWNDQDGRLKLFGVVDTELVYNSDTQISAVQFPYQDASARKARRIVQPQSQPQPGTRFRFIGEGEIIEE